jgi:hypothetical protein
LELYVEIARYQGYQAASETVGEVAAATFKIISNNDKTESRLADCVVGSLLASKTPNDYRHRFESLTQFDKMRHRRLEQVRENAAALDPVKQSESLRQWTDRFLHEKGLDGLAEAQVEEQFDDDIPF